MYMQNKFYCKWCSSTIEETKVKEKLASIKNGKTKYMFCNLSCAALYYRNVLSLQLKDNYNLNPIFCIRCNSQIPFEKVRFKLNDQKYNRTKHSFCNQSCAASYNNTHKTHGTRVSKLERWMAEKLNTLFPSLEIHYNRKDAINSELDIYIPSMKLAFELNGPFHYEPIFSEEQLKSIQNNDQRKLQACLERGIELCVIDTSKHSYVKESTCKPYLDIVLKIIELKRSSLGH